jgi:5-oxoprolinase (ATP-hydrolysing) subunit C
MSARLVVHRAGPGVTLQDAGRFGLQRFGVTRAGPMDPDAFAAANLAAGAQPRAAAIEISLGGVELGVEGGPIGVAIAGGAFDIRLDGRRLPSACALTLAPSQRLSVRPGAFGAWCYLAVCGRFDLPPTLGSLATHTRAHLGGLEGRALRAGDILPMTVAAAPFEGANAIHARWLEERRTSSFRVLLGPQDDYFTKEGIETFLRANWRLSAQSDRMAYRLEGPRLTHAKGHDIVSDGVAFGAIQAPGDGVPLVLMADRQPTGGYPKVAHVIGADLGALAQARPGDQFSFVAVSWDESVAARKAARRAMAEGVSTTPLARDEMTSEYLLSRNLVGGVSDARREES